MASCEPEQTKLTLGAPVASSVWVSWTTTQAGCESIVEFHEVPDEATSAELLGGTANGDHKPSTPMLSARGTQFT